MIHQKYTKISLFKPARLAHLLNTNDTQHLANSSETKPALNNSLMPSDYFEQHSKVVMNGIRLITSQEDVTNEIKVPTEKGFESHNNSGMVVNFKRNGEKHRAVFGVSLGKNGYNTKIRIENSKGKNIYENEREGIENTTGVEIILTLAIFNAFLPKEPLKKAVT